MFRQEQPKRCSFNGAALNSARKSGKSCNRVSGGGLRKSNSRIVIGAWHLAIAKDGVEYSMRRVEDRNGLPQIFGSGGAFERNLPDGNATNSSFDNRRLECLLQQIGLTCHGMKQDGVNRRLAVLRLSAVRVSRIIDGGCRVTLFERVLTTGVSRRKHLVALVPDGFEPCEDANGRSPAF